MSETDRPPAEEEIGPLIRQRGWTLATAESCTGGGVGARVTAVSGSSAYYQGGVIAYHNDVKRDRLGVSEETLETHGAVSAQTAAEMARGARRAPGGGEGGASVGLSVTGVAGPEGGTEEKPVGTVYIGVSSDEGETVRHFIFSGGRESVRNQSRDAALALLRDHLRGLAPAAEKSAAAGPKEE
ncbi:MAG: CinA family protein [Nitrospinota bacterium]|jgi:nicotinamide-nucleotide amidase|nr:CinA family protein [Nitrospinota bacterium]HJM41935.1 CinA family protein [Nitrospinota bacterium]